MLGTIDQRHLVRCWTRWPPATPRACWPWPTNWPSVACPCRRWRTWRCCLARGDRAARDRRHAGGRPAGRRYLAAGAGLHPDAVQLFYSVAVHSRGELMAPDEYAGFIMACLRMLALNGEAGPQTALEAGRAGAPDGRTAVAAAPVSSAPVAAPHPQAAEVEASVAPAPAPVVAPERCARAADAAVAPRGRQAVAPQSGMPAAPATEESASVAPWFRVAGKAGRAFRRARVAGRRAALGRVAMPRLPPWARRRRGRDAGGLRRHGARAAQDEPDGPPSWVDEEILRRRFVPDSGFTSDPDDEFERWPARRHRPRRSAEAPTRSKRPTSQAD